MTLTGRPKTRLICDVTAASIGTPDSTVTWIGRTGSSILSDTNSTLKLVVFGFRIGSDSTIYGSNTTVSFWHFGHSIRDRISP
jgi:hypothetical protein